MHFPSHMICNISQSSHGAMNSYSAFNENNQKDPAHLPYFNKLDWEQEINGGGGKADEQSNHIKLVWSSLLSSSP